MDNNGPEPAATPAVQPGGRAWVWPAASKWYRAVNLNGDAYVTLYSRPADDDAAPWVTVERRRTEGHSARLIVETMLWDKLGVDPLVIAKEYAKAVAERAEPSERNWDWVVPSLRYPVARSAQFMNKFSAEVLRISGELPSPDASDSAADELFVMLCQDGAAVQCGMPRSQRITCGEHRVWRTAGHLEKAHPIRVPVDGSCEFRPPGHKHCKHGHTTDCPDPMNCDVR